MLYGSNLGNASSHDWRNLPVLVAGGGFKHQGYVDHDEKDNTPFANLFVPRDTFHQHQLLITTEPFLLIEGRLQISEGGQPTIYTNTIQPLPGITTDHAAGSHDFH